MTICIECGGRADDELQHPTWPNDGICKNCHSSMWDEHIESKIQEYLNAVGSKGVYSEDLKGWKL